MGISITYLFTKQLFKGVCITIQNIFTMLYNWNIVLFIFN